MSAECHWCQKVHVLPHLLKVMLGRKAALWLVVAYGACLAMALQLVFCVFLLVISELLCNDKLVPPFNTISHYCLSYQIT